MEERMSVNGKEYEWESQYVLKQIHHEPCDYYQFGDKLQSERDAYRWLKQIGIRMPELIEVDVERKSCCLNSINIY